MSGDQEPHTNGVNGDASDDEVRLILIDSADHYQLYPVPSI